MDLGFILAVISAGVIGFALHAWAVRGEFDEGYLAGRLDEIADNQEVPR